MFKSKETENGSSSKHSDAKRRTAPKDKRADFSMRAEVGEMAKAQNIFEIRCLYPRRVKSDFLGNLPLKRYSGNITLIETEEALDENLPKILEEEILGFDTETRPSFQKGKNYKVSILQLAGKSEVWIIRLKPLENKLEELFKVLELPSIKKVGLAVQGDVRALNSLREFKAAGFEDISKFTSKMGIVNTGMRNLTAVVFGEKISKKEQCSNWANDVLSDSQLSYAATDAWMSRRLYLEVMEVIRQNRTDVEPEPEPEPEKFNLGKFIGGVIAKLKKKVKELPGISLKKDKNKKHRPRHKKSKFDRAKKNTDNSRNFQSSKKTENIRKKDAFSKKTSGNLKAKKETANAKKSPRKNFDKKIKKSDTEN